MTSDLAYAAAPGWLACWPHCQPLSACVSVQCAPWPWLPWSGVWIQTRSSDRQTSFSRYLSASTSSSSSVSSSSWCGHHPLSSEASQREKQHGICIFSQLGSSSRATASLDSSQPPSSAIVWPSLGFEDGTSGMSCHGCLSSQLLKSSSSLASSTIFFTNPSILAKSSCYS